MIFWTLFPIFLILYGRVQYTILLVFSVSCTIAVYKLWRQYKESEKQTVSVISGPTSQDTNGFARFSAPAVHHIISLDTDLNPSLYPNPPPSYSELSQLRSSSNSFSN